MSDRRKVEELVTRYEFEPSLKDVFVEGAADLMFFKILQDAGNFQGVVFYPIETVEIEDSTPHENNNRGRTVKLAELLLQKAPSANKNYACVIDKDFEDFSYSVPWHPSLFRTDCPGIENYLVDSMILQHMISRCHRANRIDGAEVASWLGDTLFQLFFIRLLNSDIRWNLSYLDFGKQVSFSGGRFLFDLEEYIRRYLNKSGQIARLSEFKEELSRLTTNRAPDVRNFAHGHDVTNLVMIALNELNPAAHRITSTGIVLYMFCLQADYCDLQNEPLILALSNHFS